MDKPHHTPGPWEVREHEGWFGIAHPDGWVLDWMSEKELSMWIKECRKIVERVNGHG